jgi:aldehyde:ferredoxin oxidoreductase
MGSKKLKAIAIRGTRPISVPDIGAMQKACTDLNAHLHQSAASSSRLAPATCLPSDSQRCPLPARNYQQSISGGAESLAAECTKEGYLLKVIACPTCPVACQHVYRVTDDPDSDEQVVLEKEALAALGTLCGIYSLPVILRAIELCQFYGLDPVSTGATAAWAMECFERGLVSSKDTQGLDLSFGSADGLVETIRRIGQRSGLGSILAEGVKRASAKIGQGSEHWAMHVKGLEIAGCDPRGTKGLALGLAVDLKAPTLDDSDGDSPSSLKDREDLAAAGDSVGICLQAQGHFHDLPQEAAQLYTLATGIPMSAAELMQAGERINNLKKAFNIREGWKRAADWLPPRLFKDPLSSGKAQGAVLSERELTVAIDDYYRARGWTPDGLIPMEKLKSLGMDDVLKMLRGT